MTVAPGADAAPVLITNASRCFLMRWTKFPEGFAFVFLMVLTAMQHMFWRYHDKHHPARPVEIPTFHENAIDDLYQRMDQLVGRTMEKCEGTDTMLMVLSDHGFNSFRRGIDLNRWLELNGYLTVDDSRRNEDTWLVSTGKKLVRLRSD